MKLDGNGRCCGRKPLVYKRDGQLFCDRCDRAFSLSTGEQVANLAWRAVGGEFVPTELKAAAGRAALSEGR